MNESSTRHPLDTMEFGNANFSHGYNINASSESLPEVDDIQPYTYSQCCHEIYLKIIQSEEIQSKALEIFNDTTVPFGKEWEKVDEFCNQTRWVSDNDCQMAIHSLTDMNYLTLPVYGYISPCLGIFTLITNVLVCVVLLKKHMINPTNILLVAMAISDLLTGIIPIPVFIHTYTLGYYREWVTCTWAIVTKALSFNLPIVCHTASIWLTVALAVHRYLCVCHSLKAKQWCTQKNILIVIAVIYVLAFLSQWIKFVDSRYESVELPSVIEPWKLVPGCFEIPTEFIARNEDVYYNVYWWFRVLFVHMIPCTSLVILNAFLVCTMRAAQARREQLMKQNRNSESRRLKESNSTTIMLVAVVAMFLLVEFPLAILMILYILQSSFYAHIFQLNEVFQMASLIINLCILLSYPFNFVIYCGMSRQFRETFKQIFIPTTGTMDREHSHYISLATENGNKNNCVTQETAC